MERLVQAIQQLDTKLDDLNANTSHLEESKQRRIEKIQSIIIHPIFDIIENVFHIISIQTSRRLSYYLDRWRVNIFQENNRLTFTLKLITNYCRVSLKQVRPYIFNSRYRQLINGE